MGTILTIIATVAVIGAFIGFAGSPSGKKAEGAVSNGIAAGCWSAGCIAQLIVLAIPVALGLLLLGLIFG